MNDDQRHEAHMEDRLREQDMAEHSLTYLADVRDLKRVAECRMNGHLDVVALRFCRHCMEGIGLEEPE